MKNKIPLTIESWNLLDNRVKFRTSKWDFRFTIHFVGFFFSISLQVDRDGPSETDRPTNVIRTEIYRWKRTRLDDQLYSRLSTYSYLLADVLVVDPFFRFRFSTRCAKKNGNAKGEEELICHLSENSARACLRVKKLCCWKTDVVD